MLLLKYSLMRRVKYKQFAVYQCFKDFQEDILLK